MFFSIPSLPAYQRPEEGILSCIQQGLQRGRDYLAALASQQDPVRVKANPTLKVQISREHIVVCPYGFLCRYFEAKVSCNLATWTLKAISACVRSHSKVAMSYSQTKRLTPNRPTPHAQTLGIELTSPCSAIPDPQEDLESSEPLLQCPIILLGKMLGTLKQAVVSRPSQSQIFSVTENRTPNA